MNKVGSGEGVDFDFLLIFWVLHLHEIGHRGLKLDFSSLWIGHRELKLVLYG